MAELLSLHLSRFQRDRSDSDRTLPPALLVFTPAPGAVEGAAPEEDDQRYRTLTLVDIPMPGVGEPLVFPVIKNQRNAFGRGITVGRTGNNDVVLVDGSVSRFHAWFQRSDDGGYTLTDAGSKNGTSLGGVRLTPRRSVPMEDGARLRFGQVEVTFYLARGFTKMLARRLGL